MSRNLAEKQKQIAVIYARYRRKSSTGIFDPGTVPRRPRVGRNHGNKVEREFPQKGCSAFGSGEARAFEEMLCTVDVVFSNIPLAHMPTKMKVSREKTKNRRDVWPIRCWTVFVVVEQNAGRMARRKLTVRNMEVRRG